MSSTRSLVVAHILKAWREGISTQSRVYVVYWPGGHSYLRLRRP